LYLLIPSGAKQLIERALWFKNPIARRLLNKKDVGFGFELKGEPETITAAPNLYWGYHLPISLSEEYYYHPEKRQKLLGRCSHIAKLKPSYVNVHGPECWWRPKKNQYVNRYRFRSAPAEPLRILAETVAYIKALQKIFPQLTLENTTLVDYYRDENAYLALTSFQTSVGTLEDLFYLRRQTGVEILLDLEHLMINLNFLNRQKNYAGLKVEPFEPTEDEKKLSKILGYKVKKGFISYAEPKIELVEFVNKIKAKKYHLTGSCQDVVMGKRDLSHGPIKLADKKFRQNLRLILAQKPESILLETASRGDNPCFSHLHPNETEISFYNLCQILLEEL